MTGILTFKNGDNVRTALASTPPGGFMLETDCPYLAPVPHRGRRCEPAYVRETAAVAASVTGRSLEEIAAETSAAAAGFPGFWTLWRRPEPGISPRDLPEPGFDFPDGVFA